MANDSHGDVGRIRGKTSSQQLYDRRNKTHPLLLWKRQSWFARWGRACFVIVSLVRAYAWRPLLPDGGIKHCSCGFAERERWASQSMRRAGIRRGQQRGHQYLFQPDLRKQSSVFAKNDGLHEASLAQQKPTASSDTQENVSFRMRPQSFPRHEFCADGIGPRRMMKVNLRPLLRPWTRGTHADARADGTPRITSQFHLLVRYFCAH